MSLVKKVLHDHLFDALTMIHKNGNLIQMLDQIPSWHLVILYDFMKTKCLIRLSKDRESKELTESGLAVLEGE